jgi:mono/diheme cytochrome c family protein
MVGLLLVASSAVRAADDAKSGAGFYRQYCGACHGPAGKGDGVVSGLMQPHPTDLTQLSKNHGGEFPLGHILQTIDGRLTIRAHGDPDMPVWGEILKQQAGNKETAGVETRGKIFSIAEYLRSIQAK